MSTTTLLEPTVTSQITDDQIGATAWNMGMWRGIFASIQDSMNWWDWVICGVTAVATIGAVFLSGGAAFIAQIALSAAAIAMVISDAAKIPDACSLHVARAI